MHQIIKQLNDQGIYIFVADGKLKTKTANAQITKEQGALIRGNKDALIAFLTEQQQQSAGQSSALTIKTDDSAPVLSFAQQRLWLLDSIEQGSSHYNIAGGLQLKGQLNEQALQQAFLTIIERHQSLRTRFVDVDQLQLIDMAAINREDLIKNVDIQRFADKPSKVLELAALEARKPFDLAIDLMLRLQLIKLETQSHVLLVTMHHIASDGWSLGVLIKEFTTLYDAYCSTSEQPQVNPLPELDIQYLDYAKWQRNYLQGEVLTAHQDYWQQQLADLPVQHNLPLDYVRPKIQQYDGGLHYSQVDAGLTQQLKTLCQQAGASLFMGLHSVFALLLARLSNEADIVIGTPIANREQAQVKDLIGFFVNTLVLRLDVDGQASFNQLLQASKRTLLDAYDHQQLPFEQVVELVGAERSLAHSPLFQVMLVLNNNESPNLTLSNLTIEPLAAGEQGVSHFDLTLNVGESQQGLQLVWEYSPHIFAKSTIAAFSAQFNCLLAAVLEMPHQPVLSLNMLDASQFDLVVNQNNQTERQFSDFSSDNHNIVQLFEYMVEQYPQHIALKFQQQSLSYAELNQRANQLARYLQQHCGVGPNQLVGLCFEPSLEMVIAIWGILKAGGAYVPLDANLPAARLDFMAQDANLTAVVTTSTLADKLAFEHCDFVCVDSIAEQLAVIESNNLAQSIASNDLVYMLYTSGSTGMPKGVLIEHGGLVNLCQDLAWRYELSEADVMVLFAPITFDMSVEELFVALARGCTLVIREAHWLDSVEHFYHCCRQYQVTVLNLPTAFWHELAWDEGGFNAEQVRHISVGGDKINPVAAGAWYQKPGPLPQLLNAYGPTECTVNASFAEVKPGSDSIGQGLSNTRLYVLNEQNALCPVGVSGQLCVAGVGVARGYRNRDDLNSTKFIDNPFYRHGEPQYYRRLYCTGDLARWNREGEVECLGRIDHQIKIRGFRIELGEIEAVIKGFAEAEIIDNLVMLDDNGGDKRLLAFVVSEQTDDSLIARLKRHLSQELPSYMMPAALTLLTEFPMTANRKVDRKALLSMVADTVSAEAKAIIAPANAIEQQLVEIWQQVLERQTVSTDDDFFALGGHSLLAMRLVSKINKQFAVNLPLRQVFAEPTLAAQALLLQPLIDDNSQSLPAIIKIERDEAQMPLSFAQQRLWLLKQIDGSSIHYNMPSGLQLNGDFNLAALKAALQALVARHEILRTCYFADDQGQGYQHIMPIPQPEQLLKVEDLTEFGCEQKQQQYLREQQYLQATTEFDLSADYMLRAVLLRMSSQQHVLLLTTHHIASDGWSSNILIDELCRYYQAYAQGEMLETLLPALSVQYADYAHWQRQHLEGEVLTQQLQYWQTQLQGLPEAHSLPLDNPRPQQQSFVGGSYVSKLDGQLTTKLNDLCQQQGATLFMALHSIFSTLLGRLSGETDIAIGTVVANREQAEIENLIGFFVNTLVLRADLAANPSFVDLLANSKQTLLDAYEHQQVPFEQLVEALQPQRNLSHSPLFQVMLVLQNNQQAELKLAELELVGLEQQSVVAKFDITLTVTELDDGLLLGWEYNSDLFHQSSIATMAQHFELLTQNVLAQVQTGVLSVPMILPSEHQQLTQDWNNTQVDFEQDLLVHQWFERQVAKQPQAVALRFEQQALSYLQLNQHANQLAHYLRQERQVTPDTLVGIKMHRSIEMVVAIVAILKAGAAYVPLDPDYPAARLDYMQADANLDIVLTEAFIRQLPLAQYSNENLALTDLNSRHLAYVIYTSGSTGQPKGVMIEHRALVNRVGWMQRQYGCDASDNILQKTPFSFDVSVWEFIWPLSFGATLVVAKPGGHLEPQYLTELMQAQSITKCHFVPSMLATMLSLGDLSQATALRQVFASGEALPLNLVEQFNALDNHGVLHNLYGPTEAAIDVSFWDCSQPIGFGHSVPIGRPIDNIELQVCDRFGHLVPVGAPGELYIGGVGLARGYLHKPQLTDERFISDGEGRRWYKTGDLARWLPNGQLAYLGRLDHQVKLRGFRIELGEIESVLIQHPQVSEIAVLADEDNQRLLAFYVSEPAAEAQAQAQELVQFAADSLPQHMVPQLYHRLAQLPLTANGKLDRKQLLAIELTIDSNRGEASRQYVAPETNTEQLLVELWSELLSLDENEVSVSDNFFALGGHSLMAMQLIAQIKQKIAPVDLTARTLFAHPQLRDLAGVIDSANSDDHINESGAFKAPQNLITTDCQRVTPQLLPLVDLTQAQIDAVAERIDGGHSNIADIYPLGPLQQGMLFHHINDPANDPYVMTSLFEITKAADSKSQVEQFIAGLEFVIHRHDVLRTAIVWQQLPQPVQVVQRVVKLPVSWTTGQLSAENAASFDLNQAPLIRLTVSEVNTGYQLLIELHHIIADHVTLDIIQQEVGAVIAGTSANLPPVVPYRDFIAHIAANSAKLDVEAFFSDMLGDVDTVTAPFNLLDIQYNQLGEWQHKVPDELAHQLRQFSQNTGLSLASVFHSVWALVVAGCSDRRDVVFGTVMSGRLQGLADVEQMAGVFINTLPFRVKLSSQAGHKAQATVLDLVKQVQQDLYDLVPYEQTLLGDAHRCSDLPSDTPLFTALLNYRHSQMSTNTDNSLRAMGGQERSNYPLSLLVDDFADGANLGFNLSVQACNSIDGERVLAYVLNVLQQICQPQILLADVQLLPKAEAEQCLAMANFNAVLEHTDELSTLNELFSAQVANHGDAIALSFADQQLSYVELNQRAEQLAQLLVAEHQVKPDTLVGICLERSVEMVVAILAVLKAGGAYVPLDPDHPASRIDYILQDAQLAVVLTHSDLLSKLPLAQAGPVCLDKQVLMTNANVVLPQVNSDNLAYVIYTSGSTGQPKGVLVTHGNVTRLLERSQQHFAFDHQDVWTLFHSYAFDFSVWELWGALAFGGRLVVVPYWGSRSPQDFYQLVCEQQVTVLNQTPSAFTSFIQQDLLLQHSLSLRLVIFGGEALNLRSLNPWFERHGDSQPKLINMYGITETTVHVTYGEISEKAIAAAQGASLIGRPLPDLAVVILDENQQLLPANVSGEMYVAGAGVTKGYLNQPDLTASRFIRLPQFANQRFYRTGDIGRYLNSGELEYLGRIDHQVKIRGFRIELGEIQHALMQIDGVSDAHLMTVAKSTQGDEDLRIVAYVVSDQITDVDTLRQALIASNHLPSYMLPSGFAILPALPLTNNGKVDVKALPAIDFAAAAKAYRAAQTPLQQSLCDIWQQVLEVEQVGIDDNYFALGGDSILAIRIVALAKADGIELSIQQLFSAANIDELSQLLSQQHISQSTALTVVAPFDLLDGQEREILANDIATGDIEDAYPLSLTQQGMIFHHLMYQAQGVYHDLFSTTMTQKWCASAFEQALAQLVADNELLRSVIFDRGHRLLHTIKKQIDLPLTLVDLQHMPAELQLQTLAQFKADDVVSGFAADKPLWYITIHRLTFDRFQFSLSFHHALLDGWSVATMQSRLLQLYLAALNKQESAKAPQPLAYRYFIAQELATIAEADSSDFWQQQLADCQLPYWTANEKQSQQQCQLLLTAEQSGVIDKLAKRLQVHEKSIFLALHLRLLDWLNGSKNTATSVVFNGRPEAGPQGESSEQTLGLFLNTLPFAPQLADKPQDWQQLILAVDRQLLQVTNFRHYPLAKIQQQVDLDFSAALFNYVNFHVYDKLADVVKVDDSETFEQTNYLYAMTCARNGDSHIMQLKFDQTLFCSQASYSLTSYMTQLVDSLAQSELPRSLITTSELQQFNDWALTTVDFDRESLIHQQFEAQVAAQPDSIALMFEGEVMSYQQLNIKANQLARHLDLSTNELMGICMERSFDMVIAILAILKAGGAYVPLDPNYPVDRLRYMAEDAQLSKVLTQQSFVQSDLLVADLFTNDQLLYLDDEYLQQQLASLAGDNLSVKSGSANDLAYVIYTSGSTGRPKGVMVEHRALNNRIDWMQQQYGCTNNDCILQKTPFSFDVSVWEFIWPLTTGAKLVLAKPGGHQQPQYLAELMISAAVTKCHFVPSMLASMLSVGDLTQVAVDGQLQQVFCSGEALALNQVEQFKQQAPQVQLHNLYGPTEAAIDVSYFSCELEALAPHTSVPIGRPINNIQFKVVDSELNLVPLGAPGELLIGGVGLARGYLNQPDLTAERFIVDADGKRWYRSGDLVRWLDDGQLAYLGRIDHQVKIRGFRIELGEIEAQLHQLDMVSESVVLAVKDSKQESRLVAYVVLADEQTEPEQAPDLIKAQLAKQLPEHMVPALVMILPQMPVTANGKADRKALPSADFSGQQSQYVAPSNDTELQLQQVWQQLLEIEPIGIDDNFFAIGGHSLTVIQLLISVNRQFAVEITLPQFFDAQTIRQLAALISSSQVIEQLQFDQQDGLGDNEMEITI